VLPDPPVRQLGENERMLILSDVLQYRPALVSVNSYLAAALGRLPRRLMTHLQHLPGGRIKISTLPCFSVWVL
jgi:hypothetical protein